MSLLDYMPKSRFTGIKVGSMWYESESCCASTNFRLFDIFVFYIVWDYISLLCFGFVVHWTSRCVSVSQRGLKHQMGIEEGPPLLTVTRGSQWSKIQFSQE